jgi:hypothetical protein
VWLKEKQCTQSSHSGRHNVYTASRRSSLHTAAADLQLLESGKAEVQESAGQWQRAWSERLTICREDLFWKEAFRVLQLVNTPDIYEENKYQRRNLLLYHCLLESIGFAKIQRIWTTQLNLSSAEHLWVEYHVTESEYSAVSTYCISMALPYILKRSRNQSAKSLADFIPINGFHTVWII